MGRLATRLDALSLQSGTVGKAEVVSGRLGSGHRARNFSELWADAWRVNADSTLGFLGISATIEIMLPSMLCLAPKTTFGTYCG
ncbi:hypothetical protein H109_00274 [Trichophyton interdigitale MR816]|uniref:Uncharacterized protein n=1 Tax=Trichophyton interdigitale (strain MR816) TaxID=1215338 RepID=A0A059JJ65_TRIIM|nr:hypothetical protein H109_00274 [Trichophyton interdigitale MR816]